MSDEMIAELAGNPELAAEVAQFEAQQSEDSVEEAPEEPTMAAPVEEEAPKRGPDQVPLPVFLDLKSELKESKKELQALKEQMQALQRPPEPPPVQDTRPSFQPSVRYEDDPAEFLRQKISHQDALIEWQERQMSQVGQQTQQNIAQQQQAVQMQQFARVVTSAETQFRAEQPDYDSAVDFIRDVRMKDAQAFAEASGVDWNPQLQAEISQSLVQEFAQIASTALQRGRNPAAALYQIAKSRGYTAPGASAESKLAQIERGMKASKTVSNMSGAAAPAAESSGDWLSQLKREAYG